MVDALTASTTALPTAAAAVGNPEPLSEFSKSSTAYNVSTYVGASVGIADGCAVGRLVFLNEGTAVSASLGGYVKLVGDVVGRILGSTVGV